MSKHLAEKRCAVEEVLSHGVRAVDCVWDSEARMDSVAITPEKHIEAIRTALKLGLVRLAHWLTEKGFAQYPDDPDLRRLAELLAPPRCAGPPVPASPATKANYEWLVTNKVAYRGQWVALRDGTLVADADDYRELLSRLGTSKGLFIVKV